MTRIDCPQEAAVLNAALTQQWTPALREHSAECAACHSVAQTKLFLQTVADFERANHTLPDADALWRRARMSETLAEQQTKVEQKFRPVKWVEAVSLLCALGGFLFWTVWNWKEVDSELASFSLQNWTGIYDAVATSTPIALWSAVGILALLLIAAFPILSSD
jgi:hypothetical protein